MFGLGPTELILIVLVIVLLFGARRIPELMRGLGSGIREFKQAASDSGDKSEKNSSADH